MRGILICAAAFFLLGGVGCVDIPKMRGDITKVELYGVREAAVSGKNNVTEELGSLSDDEIDLLMNFLYSSSARKGDFMEVWPFAYLKVYRTDGQVKYLGVSNRTGKDGSEIMIFTDDDALEKSALSWHKCVTCAKHEEAMRKLFLRYVELFPDSFYQQELAGKNQTVHGEAVQDSSEKP